MSEPQRALCPVCGEEMAPVVIYDDAHWICETHGDFPNAAFDADATKLNPTYPTLRLWLEAKLISVISSSIP